MTKHISPEKSPGARQARLPAFVTPQLATLVKAPPSGDEWLHELKFDGYRMLCRINQGAASFSSRNENDWSKKFSNLLAAARDIHAETALIDGEVVIFDRDGRSNFQKLQHAIHSIAATRFIFVAFDLIHLNGFDLTQVALEERKRLLKSLFESIPATSPYRYSDHVEGNGDLFFQHACKTGIEGIVSKQRSSFYESTRSRSWLKTKGDKRQEFVIVGFVDSEKGLPGFGALVLGVYDGNQLIYAGRVGTGFTMKQRVDIRALLDPLVRHSSALSVIPKDPGLRGAHWLEPKLVGEVAFTEWTDDGSIRHPSFQGLREDKRAQDVRRE